MEFDNNFALELKEIMPTFIVIGKDNYNNNLPEPSNEEILESIRKLKQYQMKIILKGKIKCIENKLGLMKSVKQLRLRISLYIESIVFIHQSK
jgi:hypothetical protein